MADKKDPFDDDLMAPPADDEVVELEDSALGVEELTEVDETQSGASSDGTDFGDIDLDAPVEDLPTFDPEPAPAPRKAASAPAQAPQDDFEALQLDDEPGAVEQQSFGFEEPQPSAAELSAVGEDSLSQPPRPAGNGSSKKLVFIVAGIVGVAAIGGLAVFMLSGNEAPPPVAPSAYEPQAPADEPQAAAAPVSEPAAAPVQAAEPVAEAAAEPAPAAAAAAPAEPAAAPKPEPKPEPKAAPKPEPKAAAKPAAAKPKAAVASGAVASRLLSVDVSTVGGADIVRFEFDGDAPAKIGSFALSDTPRYVVDFYGIESGPRVGAVDGRFVSGVRPGRHEGKYRVVLDMTTDGVTAKRRVDGNAVIVELRQ